MKYQTPNTTHLSPVATCTYETVTTREGAAQKIRQEYTVRTYRQDAMHLSPVATCTYETVTQREKVWRRRYVKGIQYVRTGKTAL
jgi:hypothetical protein